MFYVPECCIKISLNFGDNFLFFKIKCDFLIQLILFKDFFYFKILIFNLKKKLDNSGGIFSLTSIIYPCIKIDIVHYFSALLTRNPKNYVAQIFF